MKLFLFIVTFSIFAEARVFDMNSEKFAAYLRGNYGSSVIGKSAFEKASSYNEIYNDSTSTMYTGEFGLIYASEFFNFKFGIEVLRPPSLKGINATDVSGTSLYSLDSDVSAVAPKIGVEFNIKQWKDSRVYFNFDYGQANLVLSNAYTFTAAGNAATSNTDYTEEGRSTASLMEGSLGYELLIFDTTTMVLDVGYRSLNFTSINHNRDIAKSLMDNLPKAKGDAMLNSDGTSRTIDMTGYFASLAFRFWVF